MKFIATKPCTLAFTIKGKEYCLTKGATASLPEDNEYIQSLVAQGYLEATDEPDDEEADANATGTEGGTILPIDNTGTDTGTASDETAGAESGATTTTTEANAAAEAASKTTTSTSTKTTKS